MYINKANPSNPLSILYSLYFVKVITQIAKFIVLLYHNDYKNMNPSLKIESFHVADSFLVSLSYF